MLVSARERPLGVYDRPTSQGQNKLVKPYKGFQGQGHVKQTKRHTVVASLMFVPFFSCRDNSALNFRLCRPIMILHQGQGHRNEQEQICLAYVYVRHAEFEDALRMSTVNPFSTNNDQVTNFGLPEIPG